jgi:hypothetical protein
MDPTDPENQRRFIVLESALDERIANIPETFTQDQYFKQLVASLLRGDKDLGVGNLGGDILADVGTAGVFGRASGKRALGSAINSMEEQAIINLLGVKGGAKRFFAEATRDIASKLTPAEYDAAMKSEISRVLPKLKETVANLGPMSGEEAAAYQQMIERLQTGGGVDWSKYQAMHASVVPSVKKFSQGEDEVKSAQHDPIVGVNSGSRTVYDYDGSKWVLITQESHAQNELAYKDDYAVDIKISVFKENTEEVIKIVLRQAFPTDIGDIQLNWNDTNDYMRIPVSFTYTDWYTE